MSYSFTLKQLLKVLRTRAPAAADAVSRIRRDVEHGLLSVGLKIHCISYPDRFNHLIDALGGQKAVLEVNVFRQQQAYFCLVLPPVGNARAAIGLLEAIEHYTGTAVLNNPDIEVQICSPGRLSPVRAGLLTMAFYLGADLLRTYDLWEIQTTFSATPQTPQYTRGKRLALYEVPYGDFDPNFTWWVKKPGGGVLRNPLLPFEGPARTDLLTIKTRRDIENVNLVATLLCHAQYGGYWAQLGGKFEDDLRTLLVNHKLEHLLFAPWIRVPDSPKDVAAEDVEFLAAMDELQTAAFEDLNRKRESGWAFWKSASKASILLEMKDLLQKYRRKLVEESERVLPKKGARDR